MAGALPYVLTVYDRREGRLLRVRAFATEAQLAEATLEEQEMYARHPHVEVEGHWGRSRADVEGLFRARAGRERGPLSAPPS